MNRIKLILTVFGLSAVFLMSACGGEKDKGDAKSMTKEQAVEKVKSMFTSIGDAADANKGNCDGFADALQKVIDDNKAAAKRIEELKKDPETEKWFEEQGKAMMGEMGPVMQKMMGTMMECKDNEKVKKVSEDFKNMMQ